MPSRLARGKYAPQPDSRGSLVVASVVDVRDRTSGVHEGSISWGAARASRYARNDYHPRTCRSAIDAQDSASGVHEGSISFRAARGSYTARLRLQLAPRGEVASTNREYLKAELTFQRNARHNGSKSWTGSTRNS